MSEEKCEHMLDYEETHCVKCMKPVWLFDNENVLERISELEAIIGQRSWYKKDIGSIIDSLEKDIAELRESIKNHSGESYTATIHNLGIQLNELKDGVHEAIYRTILNKEVMLDDLKFKIDNLPDNDLKKHYEGLLEKLDMTEKKEPYKFCKKCFNFRIPIDNNGDPYPDCDKEEYLTNEDRLFINKCSQFIKKGSKTESNHYSEGDTKNINYLIKKRDSKKASGGEKVRSAAHTEYECISCGKPMKKGDICPICKPPEPKYYLPDLNAPGLILSGVFKNYIENTYKKLFPDNPPVKREDLQFLCDKMFDDLKFGDTTKIDKIKEAYKIG